MMHPYQGGSAPSASHGQPNVVTPVNAYTSPSSPPTTQPATAFPASPRDTSMYSPPHGHVHSPQASMAQGPTMSYRSQQTNSAPQITMHTHDGQQLLYSPPPASQRPYGTASKNKQQTTRPRPPSRTGTAGESGRDSGKDSETERAYRSHSGSRGHHHHHNSSRHRNYDSDRSEGRTRDRTRDRTLHPSAPGYQSSSSARSSTPAQQSSRSSTPIAGHSTGHQHSHAQPHSSHRHKHSHSHGHSSAEDQQHTTTTGHIHPHYQPTYSTAAPAQPQQVFPPVSSTATQIGPQQQQVPGNIAQTIPTGSRPLQTTHTQQPQPQPDLVIQAPQPHQIQPQPTTTTTTAAPGAALALTQHPVNVFSTGGGPTGMNHQGVLNGKSTSQISTQQGQQMVVTFNANGESQLVSLEDVKQQQLANAQANIQNIANRQGYQHLHFNNPYPPQQAQHPGSTVSGGTQPHSQALSDPTAIPQHQAQQQIAGQQVQQTQQMQDQRQVQQQALAVHKTPTRPPSQQDVATPSSQHTGAHSAQSRDTKSPTGSGYSGKSSKASKSTVDSGLRDKSGAQSKRQAYVVDPQNPDTPPHILRARELTHTTLGHDGPAENQALVENFKSVNDEEFDLLQTLGPMRIEECIQQQKYIDQKKKEASAITESRDREFLALTHKMADAFQAQEYMKLRLKSEAKESTIQLCYAKDQLQTADSLQKELTDKRLAERRAEEEYERHLTEQLCKIDIVERRIKNSEKTRLRDKAVTVSKRKQELREEQLYLHQRRSSLHAHHNKNEDQLVQKEDELIMLEKLHTLHMVETQKRKDAIDEFVAKEHEMDDKYLDAVIAGKVEAAPNRTVISRHVPKPRNQLHVIPEPNMSPTVAKTPIRHALTPSKKGLKSDSLRNVKKDVIRLRDSTNKRASSSLRSSYSIRECDKENWDPSYSPLVNNKDHVGRTDREFGKERERKLYNMAADKIDITKDTSNCCVATARSYDRTRDPRDMEFFGGGRRYSGDSRVTSGSPPGSPLLSTPTRLERQMSNLSISQLSQASSGGGAHSPMPGPRGGIIPQTPPRVTQTSLPHPYSPAQTITSEQFSDVSPPTHPVKLTRSTPPRSQKRSSISPDLPSPQLHTAAPKQLTPPHTPPHTWEHLHQYQQQPQHIARTFPRTPPHRGTEFFTLEPLEEEPIIVRTRTHTTISTPNKPHLEEGDERASELECMVKKLESENSKLKTLLVKDKQQPTRVNVSPSPPPRTQQHHQQPSQHHHAYNHTHKGYPSRPAGAAAGGRESTQSTTSGTTTTTALHSPSQHHHSSTRISNDYPQSHNHSFSPATPRARSRERHRSSYTHGHPRSRSRSGTPRTSRRPSAHSHSHAHATSNSAAVRTPLPHRTQSSSQRQPCTPNRQREDRPSDSAPMAHVKSPEQCWQHFEV